MDLRRLGILDSVRVRAVFAVASGLSNFAALAALGSVDVSRRQLCLSDVGRTYVAHLGDVDGRRSRCAYSYASPSSSAPVDAKERG